MSERGGTRGVRFTNESALFALALAVLTLAGLLPIWLIRFVPGEDYPLHLMCSYVIATYDDPSFNWKQFYDVSSGLTSYATFYYLVAALSSVMSVEAAGKVFLSLYVLLIPLVAVSVRRNLSRSGPPWGILILFPLSFHQMYFMGFMNFSFSIPVLVLALLDLEVIGARKLSVRSVLRHLVLVGVLSITHPIAILLYVVMAAAGSLRFLREPRQLARRIVWPVMPTLVFFLWLNPGSGGGLLNVVESLVLRWKPLVPRLEFYALMFTGMKISQGVDVLVTALWGVIAVLVAYAACRYDRDRSLWAPFVAYFIIALVGYLALPSLVGSEVLGMWPSYINFRMAPLSYFLFGSALAAIRLPRSLGLVLGVFSLALVLHSANTQEQLSRETEDLLPLLEKMVPNSRLLPVMEDAGSEVVDPLYFYEIHAHDYSYYHVLVGGGAHPNLQWKAPFPVSSREKGRVPSLSSLRSWEDVRRHYDYVLIRGEAEELRSSLYRRGRFSGRSGKWSLFLVQEPAGS